jgi:alanyl aminopeptidase
MGQDGLISARRIRNPIDSYSDIMSAFDRITYTKGRAVIRMFEAWAGEDEFREGVRRYLKRYAWGNASAGDFLDEISPNAELRLSAAFSSFLNQGGVPQVSVTLRCAEGRLPVVQLEQKRALPVGSKGSAGQTWMIPVCVRFEASGAERRECFLLTEAQAEWPLRETDGCPSWISANANGDGYYHVEYKGGLLEPLLAGGGKMLPSAERLSVIGDVQAGFEMGIVDGGTALRLVPELAGDSERSVVEMTIRILGQIWPHMVGDSLQENYVRFMQRAYGKRARELGWMPRQGEDAETRLLRNQVVFSAASRGEDAALAREAGELALRWLENPRALPPDIISPVLSTAAYHGGRDLFDRYLKAARAIESRTDRLRLYSALGSFRDPAIAREAMNLVLSEGFDIRESLGILMASQATPAIRRMRFDFVKQHFDDLIKRLPAEGGFQLGARLPANVGNVFCSEDTARELEVFFGPKVKSFHGGEQALAETLENVRLCSALKEKQQASVAEFLRGY